MKPFGYAAPTTLDEAITLLAGGRDDAAAGTSIPTMDGATRPLAGGTDLITLIKGDIAAPARLINVKQLSDLPAGIEDSATGGLTLGALTSLTEIETSSLIKQRYAALAEATSLAATPQLRNMATIGGNLLQRPRCWYFRNHVFHCWLKGGDACQARDGENQQHALFGGDASPCVAVHPSDPASALMALDAEVALKGAQGERTISIADFFALPEDTRRTETTVREDELVLSIRLPALPAGTRSIYLKAMDRKVWAFALVGVAAVLRLDGGRIADARLVLGGVAPIPWRAPEAEQLLVGSEPSDDLFTRAADAALADAQPLQHNAYKITLAKSLIRRALIGLARG